MSPQKLRIAIDARYLSHGLVGGVHTYLLNLASALMETDSRHEYTFWIDDKAPFELAATYPEAQTHVLPWRTPASSLRNDRRIGMIMRRAGADILHFPANYGFAPPGVPTIVTIHDAINALPLPEIIRGHARTPRTIATMTYLHLATRRTLGRRPFVITVSRHARREILRHADLDPDQVRVIYHAPEDAFRPISAERTSQERERLGTRANVVLADAIKNPLTALNAYRRLPDDVRERTSLIFFSRRDPDQSVLEAVQAGECALVLRPTRDDLAVLYNLADVFLFPSWYEGFGLPVLEAMACGTPVVGSGAGAIPEIIEDTGLIVADPNDHEAFSKALGLVLGRSDYRLELRERALERAGAFSWQRAAQETESAYVDALDAVRSRAPRSAQVRHARN